MLDEEGYRRYFDRFLSCFFDAADARYLASLGLNSVRIPFNAPHRHAHLDRRVRPEPMVGDFARCFEGVTPDEAEELAGPFAFDRCVRRTPLAEALREHLGSAVGDQLVDGGDQVVTG